MFSQQNDAGESTTSRTEYAPSVALQNSRNYANDSQSVTSSDQISEGDNTIDCVKWNNAKPVLHIPLTSGAFTKELESMVGTMSQCSFGEKHYDTDLDSFSEIGSVYDDASVCRSVTGSYGKDMSYYPVEAGDWQAKMDWQNGNYDVNNSSGAAGGRSSYMTQGRHHSMYVSNSRSSYCGDYSTFSGHNEHISNDCNDNSAPTSLPLSVATIHRRIANPRVPIFDAQTNEKPEAEATQSTPAVMHRNNSLPRPHSYAAPHSNFMKYRLSLAKKRDLV